MDQLRELQKTKIESLSRLAIKKGTSRISFNVETTKDVLVSHRQDRL